VQLVCLHGKVWLHGSAQAFAVRSFFAVRLAGSLPSENLCRALLPFFAVRNFFAVRHIFLCRDTFLCRALRSYFAVHFFVAVRSSCYARQRNLCRAAAHGKVWLHGSA
jgi:hypothetical protein